MSMWRTRVPDEWIWIRDRIASATGFFVSLARSRCWVLQLLLCCCGWAAGSSRSVRVRLA